MMFKGTKIAIVVVMILVFSALALSGCMPMAGSGNIDSGGADPTPSSGLMGFLPLILIIVVFYFILIRPQNKKNKQVNEMRNALKRGDWVTTIGGLRGRVVKVREDLLTIEVGTDKVKLEIMRWGISKIDESAPERKSSTKKRDEEPDEKEEEEEKPKRKPKKLAPVPKKDEKPEDEESEGDEGSEEANDEDDE